MACVPVLSRVECLCRKRYGTALAQEFSQDSAAMCRLVHPSSIWTRCDDAVNTQGQEDATTIGHIHAVRPGSWGGSPMVMWRVVNDRAGKSFHPHHVVSHSAPQELKSAAL